MNIVFCIVIITHFMSVNASEKIVDNQAKEKANTIAIQGRTPLHYAQSSAKVKAFLAAGFSVHCIDDLGRTPLFNAPDAQSVELLIASGAQVNIKDKNGCTPLHTCSTYYRLYGAAHELPNCKHPASALIKAGANIDEENNDGMVPLFCHITREDLEGVKLLLQAQADPNATTHSGVTCLDAAVFMARALERINANSAAIKNMSAIIYHLLNAGAYDKNEYLSCLTYRQALARRTRSRWQLWERKF